MAGATELELLMFQMDANIVKLQKKLDKANGYTDKSARAMQKRWDDAAKESDRKWAEMSQGFVNGQKAIEKALADSGGGIRGFIGEISLIAPALAAAFSTTAIIAYADSYKSLENRLKAAGLEGTRLKQVEDALYEAANKNGLAVNATAELYSRASMARENLGASEEQLLALVSGTAAALKVQGVSAEAASGPLMQLGQVLGGTKVQAEEYNSLIDGLPTLLQAAANGSERFGGSVAKLTQEVKAGKVTSQEFFNALLAGFPAIEKTAQSAAVTVESAIQTLNNQLGRYIGQTDQGLSATDRMAQAIVLLAENLDKVTLAAGIAATAIAGTLAGRAVGGATASFTAMAAQIAITNAQLTAAEIRAGLAAGTLGRLTASGVAASGAMRGLSGAMAFFGGPVGLAVTAVVTAVGLLAVASADAAAKNRELDQNTASLRTRLDQAELGLKNQARVAKGLKPELDKTAVSVAALTGEQIKLRDAAYQAAAALKAQYLADARKNVAEAKTNLAAREKAYKALEGKQRQSSMSPLMGGATIGSMSVPVETSRDRQIAMAAVANSPEAMSYREAQSDLARATAILKETEGRLLSEYTTKPSSGGSGGNAKASKDKSKTYDGALQAYKNDAIDLDYQAKRETDAYLVQLKARYEGVDQAAEDLKLTVTDGFEVMASEAEQFATILAEDIAYAFGDAIARGEDLGDAFADVVKRMVATWATSGLMSLFGVDGSGKSTGGGLLGLLKGNGLTDINKDGSRGIGLGSILSTLPVFGGVFGSIFGGKRAGGGAVQAGKVYQVNDGGGQKEFFAAAMNGRVMTAAQMNAAMARPMARSTAAPPQDVNIVVTVDGEGRIQAYVAEQSQQAAVAGAVNGSQMAQSAMIRRQSRTLR